MTRNAKHNYDGKCGTCKHFAFHVINGVTRERGMCELPIRKHYHQASQKGCKKYEKYEEKAE